MRIRETTADDSDHIRAIAEDSLQASYALSPLDIEAILEAEFADDRFAGRVDDDDRIVLLAESDDTFLGFVEAHTIAGDYGEIEWLHVDPTARGNGVGTELTERVLAELRERAVEGVRAVVLGQNQEGGEFFEQFGFKPSDQTDRNYGDRTLHAERYSNIESEWAVEDANTVPESGVIHVDGRSRFIDPHESISGDEGAFLLVFEEEGREERLGFYCTNCGSFTDSVDGGGKVICENCGNVHNPEEWDESYL